MDDEGRVGWRDTWLPALLLTLGAAELATLGSRGWIPSVGLEALAAVLLVFRRRYALVVVPASAVALMLIPLTGTAMNEAAAPILFYILGIFSLGRYIPGLRGVAGLVAIVVAIFVVSVLLDPRPDDWTDVIFVLSLAVPPYVFGRIVRKLDEQGRALAAQQEVIARQAVTEERARISRELHDVIAHSISVMVVQTAAAQDVVRTDPEKASELLASVADTGRDALAETGRLLHLVRDEADELGLKPAPGLAEVPALVESFRAGGLQVEDDLDLPTEAVPGGVDVSAYRVVQEALTNALKYGNGHVQLVIDTGGDHLRISCSNPVGTPTGHGAGLGLLGMAERIGLLGGTLERGAGRNGTFVVEARIPLAREHAS